MKQNKIRIERWRKIVALLLSVSMIMLPFAPGIVYAENNNILLITDDVENNECTHNWGYSLSTDDTVIIATCSGGSNVSCNKTVNLTVKAEKGEDNKYKAVVLADGEEIQSGDNLGITYTEKYCNSEGEKIEEEEAKKEGNHKIRVTFGEEGSGYYLDAEYTVSHNHTWTYSQDGEGKSPVTATCGDRETCRIGTVSLTMKAEKGADNKYKVAVLANETEIQNENTLGIVYIIKYCDSEGKEIGEAEAQKKEIYKIRVIFGEGGNTAYLEEACVGKNNHSGIRVLMKNYDLESSKLPLPQLDKIDKKLNLKVAYYYNTTNKNIGGKKWGSTKLKKGTYYMYAVIEETSNYNAYTTQTTKFTVYGKHKWDTSNMPKKLKAKVQKREISCSHCGEVQNVTLPQKTVSVVMGKSQKINSKGCTFTLGKSAKVKKAYFNLSKAGKIKTKAKSAYYSTMQTSVPIVVNAYGKKYSNMAVKLKIPAPKNIKIKCTKILGGSAYQFRFTYNVPGAKIQVRLQKGETSAIRNELDRYVSGSKSTSESYLNLTSRSLKKYNNKITFIIRAYYGERKSEKITKTITAK